MDSISSSFEISQIGKSCDSQRNEQVPKIGIRRFCTFVKSSYPHRWHYLPSQRYICPHPTYLLGKMSIKIEMHVRPFTFYLRSLDIL